MSYSELYSTRRTPQTQRTPGRTDEVENSEGGFVFAVNDWDRFRRFLILGSDKGSFYAGARELTIENATSVRKCIDENGLRAVAMIVEVSDGGKAVKNEPALFALAMATAADNLETRKAAWSALPKVARIGTHLFQFVEYREAFGGWGRLAREGIAEWYYSKTARDVAYQVLKYAQRNGWTHRDVLRLAHPKPENTSPELQAIFGEIVGKPNAERSYLLPKLYEGVERAKNAATEVEVICAIEEYRLTREMIPTEWLKRKSVQEALFESMPITAMIRNLGNLTKAGVFVPMNAASKEAAKRLRDENRIRKGRVHPLTLLAAARTYGSGRGFRGRGEWEPVPEIVEALEDAFELSFETVEPSGKRFVYGVDVSSSMNGPSPIDGISCAEVAGVLALVSAKVEPDAFIGGFAGDFVDLGITRKDTFQTACRRVRILNFGATDCAKPFTHALKRGIEADQFVVLTDNETYAGRSKPHQALQTYRDKTGIPAKLVVVGMTSNGFTIADPRDAGMLDIVGMSTDVPKVISDFARG